MAKKNRKVDPRVKQVQNDLEAYRIFCRDFGYKYDESTMYNMKTYPFQQFNKYRNKKRAKDQWSYDARRFGREIGEALS